LRAAVSNVDAGLVELHRHAAERGDAIGDHQSARSVSGGTDGLAGLQRSRRSLGVDIRHNLRFFATNKLSRFVLGVGLSPRLFQARDVGAVALRHLRKPVGEISVGKHRDLGSGLNEIGHGSFHARAARAGNDQRGASVSSEGGLEQLLHVGHHLDEIRIEVPTIGFDSAS